MLLRKLKSLGHHYHRLGPLGLAKFSIRSIYLSLLEWEGHRFDRKHHVSTSGVHNAADPIYSGTALTGYAYRGVSPSSFRAAMRSLRSDFANYQFVDLGSGKGRALFLAAQYRFQRVVGVELSAELHRIAAANVEAFRRTHQDCCPIDVLNLDASDYDISACPTVFFCFNALPAAIVARISAQIAAPALADLDFAWIQVNPKREVVEVLEKNPRLKMNVRRRGLFGQHSCVVFTSN